MSNLNEIIFFSSFLAFIALMLGIDLGFFQRKIMRYLLKKH